MSLLNTTTTTMAVVTMIARQRCGTKWCSSSPPQSTFSDRFSPAALVATAHSKEASADCKTGSFVFCSSTSLEMFHLMQCHV